MILKNDFGLRILRIVYDMEMLKSRLNSGKKLDPDCYKKCVQVSYGARS